MAESRRFNVLVILSLITLVVVLFWALVFKSARQIEATPVGHGTDLPMPEVEWSLVTTWPKNFPGLGSYAVHFADSMAKMTDGRFKVHVYGAGELVPALGVFGAVSSGSAQAGHGAAYYWKGKVPAAQFFTAVPFGLNAQEMNGWIHYGGGLELWRDLYEPFNLRPYAGGSTGVQMAGWFNKEINTVDDIKGLKMRIPGLAGEVWNRAGGSSVNIPGGELYTSLQTGVIDATEWVGPYNDLAFGFYQVAEYYYYPGWHEPGAMLELIINQDAYNQLPPHYQAMVDEAARQANQDMLDEYTARNNAALEELINVHNVKLRQLPEPVLRELKAIADSLYEEVASEDEDFAKVYKAFREFGESVAKYHVISEEAYYQARKLK